jgi:hypothetical protein
LAFLFTILRLKKDHDLGFESRGLGRAMGSNLLSSRHDAVYKLTNVENGLLACAFDLIVFLVRAAVASRAGQMQM